ncbi:hypothetical protein BK139_01835 [Paenibacillus sp. FSL R5-0490]|uniref:hypothetical protein n=1 Tax=Bacillales TaxID=1385 RepID=UPI00096F3C82|nr:hypothetical protein [Paenibacillus sp. FSL R5-0490]OMF63428.1 hypothetical protein BK139_01835 [Paenibacillus sp. FSL R5-0490]
MKVNVSYLGKEKGTADFSSLPSLILYCSRHGLDTTWSREEKTLYIDNPQKNQILLLTMEGGEDSDVLQETSSMMKELLKNSGIVLKTETDQQESEGTAFHVHLEFTNSENIVITCKKSEIIPVIQKHCRKKVSSRPYVFFKTDGAPHKGGPSIFCEIPVNFTGLEEFLIQLQAAILEHFIGSSELLNWVGLETVVELFSSGTSEKKKHRQQKRTPDNRPAEVKPQVKAEGEAYFNYTIRPHSSNEKYTLITDLVIKNTGTAALHNPIVCLRVNPPAQVEIGGQILPPEMVEVLAVQGTEGALGWQYANDDWLQEGYEKGEFWIRPINTLSINPEENDGIYQFHLNFDKLEKGTCTVEAFVYFREQDVTFKAMNDISFSF